MSYNGWSNRATWNVNLWIDNDEPLYRNKIYWLEMLSKPPSAADATFFVYQHLGTYTPDGYAVADANFQELADSWLEDWENSRRNEQ